MKLIKVIEKELLEDEFIIKSFVNNVKLNEPIYFSKDNIYYFGNYKNDSLAKIENKLINNKKRIIKAIENGVKFIVCGNSVDLFNNSFNHKELNLFTCYNPNGFKKAIKGIKVKQKYKHNKIKKVNNIKEVIPSENFLYRNFLCVRNEKIIEKVLYNLKYIGNIKKGI